jgi:signal transduction histidine kinase
VREGLEELRRREDARPFYLYNHFYSPPEVLAVGDAVAVSPLAADPDDPRVVGHFQVDPGERVRTPYPVDDVDPGPPRARRISAIASAPAFAPLRALSFGTPAPLPDRRLASADSPLTTNLGQLSNQAYQAIAALNEADAPTQQRARKQVPVTSRNQVSWAAIQSQQARNVPIAQANDAAPVFQQIAAQQAQNSDDSQIGNSNANVTPQAPAIPQAPRPRPPATVPEDMPDRAGPEGQVDHSPLPQGTEVDYTPMAYLALGDQLVLQRVVSHADTGSVQGVLLDRAYLLERWLPAVAGRHTPAGEVPRIVADAAACASPQPISEQLPGAWLCLAAAAPPPDRLAFQTGALLGLIAVVGFGVVVVARAARRADELSAQKTAFVSAVSHELRTPLTTLRMHAELLQEGLVAPGSLATFYDDLVRESVRLGRLVENVLAVSQLEEGRRVLDLRPGDLAAHVRDVVAGQARHVASKGFPPVELDLPDEPLTCRFDAQAIEQIVVNLLDNALKYAAEGGPASLRIALETPPGRALLRVQDRGPGIPEAERERVFQRFVRVQRASTAHTPGTGLGLSLVRDLARAHGGDAQVSARPGGGADLQVWIPRDPA